MLKPGDRFDADVLDAERTRVTDHLRHLGYLYLTRDMVLFDADTSAGDHQVDVTMRIERPTNVGKRGLQGTPEGRVYFVQDVFVDVRSGAARRSGATPDTARYEGFTVLYKGKRSPFSPKTLSGQILLKPDARFNQVDADRTFRRLTNLRVFDRVELTYDTIGLSRPELVNSRITLLPAKRQAFSVEGFLTNRGGSLGTSVNLSYRHKNMFRRMAALQASFSFGFEAQQSLSQTVTSSEGASTSIGNSALFNTLEIGPELSLRFPAPWGSAKSGGSRIVVSTLYNYQRRPDYTRSLAKASLGVELNTTLDQVFGFYPFEVNVIRIPYRSAAFQEFIANVNDPILTNSYTDNLIPGMRLVWTLNTQSLPGSRRKNWFLRGVAEWAGTMVTPFGRETRDSVSGGSLPHDRRRALCGIREARPRRAPLHQDPRPQQPGLPGLSWCGSAVREPDRAALRIEFLQRWGQWHAGLAGTLAGAGLVFLAHQQLRSYR